MRLTQINVTWRGLLTPFRKSKYKSNAMKPKGKDKLPNFLPL